VNRATQLSHFADQDPSNPSLLCDLLDELLSADLVDDAVARIRLAPQELRRLPAVKFREARCAMLRGESAEVVEILQPLIENMPDVPAGVTHDVAYAQLVLGQPDKALATLGRADSAGEDGVAIGLLKARILHRLQQFDAALDALASLSGGARQAEIHGVRALVLLDAGDTTRASSEAEKALALDPQQHEAALVRGTVALWDQQTQVSTETFEHVLADHPRSGRALLGLGQCLMLRGDIPVAHGLLERASVEIPDHIGTWHALAWCQLIQGDLSGAKRSFDRAFAIDRTFGETHGGFALVFALRGERAQAEESIKRATRLDPKGRSALYARSVLLLDDGHTEAAVQVVQSALLTTRGLAVDVSIDFLYRLRDIVRPRS